MIFTKKEKNEIQIYLYKYRGKIRDQQERLRKDLNKDLDGKISIVT